MRNFESLKFCSLPDEEKPINNYISLKENSFFHSINLLNLFNLNWFFIFFFFTLFHFTKIFFFICFIIIFFLFIELFKIYKNLISSYIIYEESSWFDIEIWEKPFFLIRKDKLLSIQKIYPNFKNFHRKILFFLFFTFSSSQTIFN
jgi:hypothetical protein